MSLFLLLKKLVQELSLVLVQQHFRIADFACLQWFEHNFARENAAK
jgi:hypothetical protein